MKFHPGFCFFLSWLCLSACTQVPQKPPEPMACVFGGATAGAAVVGVVSSGSSIPAGAFVGALTGGFQCTDQDQDSIVDRYDRCPNTPLGAPVNLEGCSKDSDEDGVVDYVDACPHSAVSFEVDSRGCPIPLGQSSFAAGYKVPDQCGLYVTVSQNRLTRAKPIQFKSNSTAIGPEGFMTLMCVADAVKGTQAKKVQIEGYTDATGSASYNQKLAQRRIANAKVVLLSEGIPESSLAELSYGQENPVAGNQTALNRAYNRRVEVKAIY